MSTEIVLKHEWILCILDDIRNYAQLNGLPTIEAEVEKVRKSIAYEISSKGHLMTTEQEAGTTTNVSICVLRD